MRDIGTRIRRYRLTRFARGNGPFFARFRWLWPIVGLWIVYVGLISEHSLLRLWRMNREGERMRADLAATRQELDGLEARMKDPRARRDQGEHILRERSGWARPGEIIYRIPADADTSEH